MTKKFLLLLILFVVLFCACVAVLLAANNPSWFGIGNSKAGKFSKQNNIKSTTTMNSLSLSPVNQTVIQGQPNTIHVFLDSKNASQEDAPKIVQLEISFDPKAVTNVTITAGDFFQNPTIVLNLINQKTGRISYALDSPNQTQQQATGTVALITFTPNPTFAGKKTAVSFLPKTTIRTSGKKNILNATYGTRLIFGSSQRK